MYKTICPRGATNDLALVPVRYIALDESSRHSKGFSPQRILTGGILMPSYACTLNSIPIPISKDYALVIFDRLAPAIDYWIEPQTSFRKVQAQYGGALHEFSLDGINKQYDTIMKTKNKYISEIIFKI